MNRNAPASPLVLDAKDVGRRPGSMHEVSLQADAPADFGTDVLSVPQGQPMDLQARMESVHEGVLVTGTVSATATGACVRCLDEIDLPVDNRFQELFVWPDRAKHHREVDAEADEQQLAGPEPRPGGRGEQRKAEGAKVRAKGRCLGQHLRALSDVGTPEPRDLTQNRTARGCRGSVKNPCPPGQNMAPSCGGAHGGSIGRRGDAIRPPDRPPSGAAGGDPLWLAAMLHAATARLRLRAIISVIALYALVLQALAGSLSPAPATETAASQLPACSWLPVSITRTS